MLINSKSALLIPWIHRSTWMNADETKHIISGFCYNRVWDITVTTDGLEVPLSVFLAAVRDNVVRKQLLLAGDR